MKNFIALVEISLCLSLCLEMTSCSDRLNTALPKPVAADNKGATPGQKSRLLVSDSGKTPQLNTFDQIVVSGQDQNEVVLSYTASGLGFLQIDEPQITYRCDAGVAMPAVSFEWTTYTGTMTEKARTQVEVGESFAVNSGTFYVLSIHAIGMTHCTHVQLSFPVTFNSNT